MIPSSNVQANYTDPVPPDSCATVPLPTPLTLHLASPQTSSSQLSHSSPPVETYVTVCPFRVSAPQYHDLRTQLGSSPCQVPLPDSPPAIPPMDFSVSSDPGHIEAHVTTRPGHPRFHRQSLQECFLFPILNQQHTGSISHTFLDDATTVLSAPAFGSQFHQSSPPASLPLTIPLTQAELDALPWETIAADYLCRHHCRMPSSSRTATERPILLGIPPCSPTERPILLGIPPCSHGSSFPNPCPPDPDPDPDDNLSHSDVPSTDHSPSSNPFLPRFRPTPPTATELDTFLRGLRIPLLLCHRRSPLVAWFYSYMGTLLGPYGGQYSQLGKTIPKLTTLDASQFFVWYKSLRSALNSTGFHVDLLPQAMDLLHDADLGETPTNGGLVASLHILFGPHFSISATSAYFEGEHHRFGNTLYSVLSSSDVLPLRYGDKAKDLLDKHSPTGDDFGVVLQDLLLFFHPGLRDNFAPGFAQHLPSAPQYTILGNQTNLDALTKYNTLYTRWLELLYLYPEHSTFRPVDLPLHYIQGLGSNAHFLEEELCSLHCLKSDDIRLYSQHVVRLQRSLFGCKLKGYIQSSSPSCNTFRLLALIIQPMMQSTCTQQQPCPQPLLTTFLCLPAILRTLWTVFLMVTSALINTLFMLSLSPLSSAHGYQTRMAYVLTHGVA